MLDSNGVLELRILLNVLPGQPAFVHGLPMQPSMLQPQVLQVSQGDGVRTSREHCLVGEFLAASSENFEDSLIYNNRMTFFIVD